MAGATNFLGCVYITSSLSSASLLFYVLAIGRVLSTRLLWSLNVGFLGWKCAGRVEWSSWFREHMKEVGTWWGGG
jgi:hypothetical protein